MRIPLFTMVGFIINLINGIHVINEIHDFYEKKEYTFHELSKYSIITQT